MTTSVLERNREDARRLGHHRIDAGVDPADLAEALLEVRELVGSGSEAMHIIDEALGKVGISPFGAAPPTLPLDNDDNDKDEEK